MDGSSNQAERPDIATTIHKAVRKILFDHAMLLGRTDFHSIEECRAAHGETAAAFRKLREHADHEDQVVFPELARSDAGLAAEAMRQHEDLEAQMRDIERLSSLSVVATTIERADVGRRLRAAVHDFVAAQLAHLAFEERVLLPALWATHSDAEIFAMHARIQGRMTPERGLEWRGVLLASIDASERARIGA